MKKIFCIPLLFVASLALFSCDKSENTPKFDVPIVPSDPTIKGIAADGATTMEIKVALENYTDPTTITISPKGEAFGLFSDSAESVDAKSTLTYTIKQEDISRKYATLYLHSQETLPSELSTKSVATITYNITVESDSEPATQELQVEVVRPPVIFAHGFGSDRTTFDPMLSYIKPKGLYVDGALYALDYSATSLSSYDVNKSVIADAIDHTKETMRASGYLFEKAVLVGHSMGGVLTRLYMQSSYGVDYRDDILKIICIDSPFMGTQLANFGVSLAERYPESPLKIIPQIGAIVDFQVDSEATLSDLNGETLNSVILPTHILSATFGDTQSIVKLIQKKQYAQALLTFLVQHVATDKIYAEDNDLIVPLSSQICGVSDSILKDYVTTYSGEWHCSVHTKEVAAEDLIELLDTQSSSTSKFSHDGFAPEQLSYDNANTEAVTMVAKSKEELLSASDIVLWIGLNAEGSIVDMGYKSDSKKITMASEDVVMQQIIGVSSSDTTTIYYSEE